MPLQRFSPSLDTKSVHKKDLDTLFIVAGCAGAGKSTIIRTSHLLNLPLFGDDFHKNFEKPAQVQILMNTKAILMQKYGSIFQARHIARLERDS